MIKKNVQSIVDLAVFSKYKTTFYQEGKRMVLLCCYFSELTRLCKSLNVPYEIITGYRANNISSKQDYFTYTDTVNKIII